MISGRGPEGAGAAAPVSYAVSAPAQSFACPPSVDPRSVRGVYFFPDELPFEALTPSAAGRWTGETEAADEIPLPRSEIRQLSCWGYALSRSVWWGRGKRHMAAVGLVASCALMAACASAVRSVPQAQTASLASLDGSVRLPRSVPALRSGRPAAAPIETARLEQAPQSETFLRGDQAPAEAPQANEAPQASEDPQPSEAQDSPAVGAAPAQESGWSSLLRRDTAPEGPVTKLVAFRSAPFPYNGASPSGAAFFNVVQDGRRGHRGRRGQILWEAKTFNDNRVLVHVPAYFDVDRPAVMVLFLHGYGATLARDVGARQQVPQQISASGANAVLVAPQFAVDARDPSIGHFWEPGGFRTFLHESAQQLARAAGNPGAVERFEHMPIVIVAYSGGFYPGSFCLKDIAGSHRVRGILMLDAAYGEFERYADWAAANRSSFLVSSYTQYTAHQNAGLKALLEARGVPINASLGQSLVHGGATFFAANYPHNDYVTQAWTEDPIRDLLARMPELRRRDPQAIASVDTLPTASIH